MATVIKVATTARISRGGGVETIPLITHASDPSAAITTGISSYPVGGGAPLHIHNCDEQVTLLSGAGDVVIEGAVTALVPYDSTYIPAGVEHQFINTGDEPMTILWIYPTQTVTRTMIATGEVVEHLSARDLMG